jgi:ABC-type transporter Mla maintaining outer membrane lipid asymmetry permease subunit MlaE
MAGFLHLVKSDSATLAASVIEANRREPGALVTVVLLDGAAAPTLAADVTVRRLAEGDLDYAELLDLIFAHDHVVTW